MPDTFVFSKILPLNSIINPEVYYTDYLDSQSPFTFFDYIKYINGDIAPNEINDLYLNYLKQWSYTKNNNEIQTNDTIQQRYTDLLKDITLNYTTSEEKRFLSNIDFEDQTELDIVLPFYAKKLTEICNFYCDKREKLKYKTEKNKIKGSSNSLQHSIYESITDVLFADSLEVGLHQKTINRNNLLKNLNIEIEELYDIYTSYLDNDPSKTYKDYDVKGSLRQELYSSNINKIDAYLYLDFEKSVKSQILDNLRTFLTEFGRIFTINYDIDSINLDCKPDERLYNLVTDSKPTAIRLVQLRNTLIKKYIGSDFYYIQTGSTITDMTSALLFKADNPTGNLLNRHFPTTASIEEETELQSCRRIGLFFTPEKNSILYFSVPEKKYKIDNTKLKANTLYIFPDPDLYGNTSGLSRKFDTEYPLIHICEYTKSIKNYSSPYIEGDIDSSPYTQDFYAYFSKNQINDSIYLGKNGFKTNFSDIYNKGVITKWASDIYGNQFALFKPKSRKDIVNNIIIIKSDQIVCEEYDGGPISFFTNGLLPENIIASNPKWVMDNVWTSSYYYNLLIEGGIGGIRNGLMERGMYLDGYIVDGLTLNRNYLSEGIFDININPLIFKEFTYIDAEYFNNTEEITFKWDINPLSGNITPNTYDYIIDNNFYIRNPKNIIPKFPSTLDGTPENASDFDPSFSYGYILSSIKYKDFDAGHISDICSEDFNFETQTRFIIEQTRSISKTLTANNVSGVPPNFNDLRNSEGSIYIKDIITGNITTFLLGLDVQFKSKYNSYILKELENSVIDFNIYNDIIWIRTKNYIVIEKIKYEDNKFVYTGTTSNYISYGGEGKYLDNISNPFMFENRNYSLLVQLSGINTDSNEFCVFPVLYKIYYDTATKERIYPYENSSLNTSLSVFKNIPSKNNIKLKRINKPFLTYNTRNDKFCIATTIEDQNEFPYIYQIKFGYDGENILDIEAKLYNLNIKEYFNTINFYDIPSLSGNHIIFNSIIGNSSKIISDGELTLF